MGSESTPGAVVGVAEAVGNTVVDMDIIVVCTAEDVLAMLLVAFLVVAG